MFKGKALPLVSKKRIFLKVGKQIVPIESRKKTILRSILKKVPQVHMNVYLGTNLLGLKTFRRRKI